MRHEDLIQAVLRSFRGEEPETSLIKEAIPSKLNVSKPAKELEGKVQVPEPEPEILGPVPARTATTTDNLVTGNEISSPIKVGWLIVYRDGKELRGGPEDKQAGLVVNAEFNGREWCFAVANGNTIPAHQVRGVTETNVHGESVAGWVVRDCGLDGRKSKLNPKRHQLRDFSRETQQQIGKTFGMTEDVIQAFATGEWSPGTWKAFWGTDETPWHEHYEESR